MNQPVWEIREGDVLDRLREMPDESVHMVCTSPPYWGLRDYGTAAWDGGDPDCGHKNPARSTAGLASSGLEGGQGSNNHQQEAHYRDVCGRCGARRVDQQIGLEPTPAEYLARMVAVFAEVRRVLRSDGTCWVNMGDSYSSGTRTTQVAPTLRTKGKDAASGKQEHLNGFAVRPGAIEGMAGKQLLGMPWRLAFALQADGWWLRSEIIWAKPNPMPESVTDRPTKAHEQIFLLTKASRYFYDADAIREPQTEANAEHLARYGDRYKRPYLPEGASPANNNRAYAGGTPGGRNARSVWTMATQPFAEAHFATFPEELPRRCILAGCPEGGTVLDPFAGSGTTLMVAVRHGRSALGIELNPEYAAMARRRILADHGAVEPTNGHTPEGRGRGTQGRLAL